MTDRGMSDDQIERVFGSLARIEQKIDSQELRLGERLDVLAKTDEAQGVIIQKMQIEHSRMKGVVSALSVIGTVLGAALGYLADVFTIRGGSH
jgi:F0F1-type ATP synthase assembly protein I